MFRMWKSLFTTPGFAPFEDAVDAGSGGGGAHLSDAGDGSQLSDGDVADDGAVADGGADGDEPAREDAIEDLLLDDVDDDDQPTRTDAERMKALTKKHRKVKRQLARLLPLAKRLDGVDLDDLVTSKRQYEQLAAQIRSNPRLRAIFEGEAEPAESRRTPAKDVEEQFDESKLPFDPNANPTNRYFANLAKQYFESQKVVRQLQARLDGADGRESARTEAQVKSSWVSTITAAVGHIKDDGVQVVFKDLMAAAYRDPDVRKRFTVQQLVSHYLKVLKVDPAQAAKATTAAAKAGATPPVRTAATQQRIAEQNKTLPRTVAATGLPAPARSNKPSLATLRKTVGAIGRA